MSGLTSAVRLAESGAKVLVLATGSGAVSLAPGTVDVFGYRNGERVSRPLAAVAEAQSDHPYAAIGAQAVQDALSWLTDAVARGPIAGYEYAPGEHAGTENLLLPTALGAVKPTALAPASLAAGDVRQARRVLAVGFDGLKDFHPRLIAANLERSEYGVRARAVTLPRPDGLALEATSLNLARFVDDPHNAEALGVQLRALVRDGEAIALPAILGLKNAGAVLAAVQERAGAPVYEIPTLPPSVAGMRLLEILRSLLRRAGGQVVLHARVTGAEIVDRQVGAVTAHVSGRDRRYEAAHFVVATGGLTSGAISLGSDWVARESAFGMPVALAPGPSERRFAPDYFDSHPISRAGVAVDSELVPLDSEGERVAENLRVVGATIAGAEAWREKSGDGISVASGYKAAGLIAASLPIASREAAA